MSVQCSYTSSGNRGGGLNRNGKHPIRQQTIHLLAPENESGVNRCIQNTNRMNQESQLGFSSLGHVVGLKSMAMIMVMMISLMTLATFTGHKAALLLARIADFGANTREWVAHLAHPAHFAQFHIF